MLRRLRHRLGAYSLCDRINSAIRLAIVLVVWLLVVAPLAWLAEVQEFPPPRLYRLYRLWRRAEIWVFLSACLVLFALFVWCLLLIAGVIG